MASHASSMPMLVTRASGGTSSTPRDAGSLLSDGKNVINPIHSYWWLLLFPAAAMSLTLVALNFLGDALRDALDPRARR